MLEEVRAADERRLGRSRCRRARVSCGKTAQRYPIQRQFIAYSGNAARLGAEYARFPSSMNALTMLQVAGDCGVGKDYIDKP